MNIALLLEMTAGSSPARVAISTPDAELTFAAMHERAQASARLFASGPGKIVAYVGVNSIGFPLALFGSALAGRPFSPNETGKLLRRVLKQDVVAQLRTAEGTA